MRTFVYIDGLNLERSAEPYGHWLDPVGLVRRVMPSRFQIESVKYFSSRLSDQPGGARVTDRASNQVAYHKALRAHGVEMIYGRMSVRTIVRPITNLPIAGMRVELPSGPVVFEEGEFEVVEVPDGLETSPKEARASARMLRIGAFARPRGDKDAFPEKKWRKQTPPPRRAVYAEVSTREEKGTDVNLAAHLLSDAGKNHYDGAVIFSNDTDFAGAIELARHGHNKEVWIVYPARTKLTGALVEAATAVRKVREHTFKESQYPDTIPGTTISIPNEIRRAIASPGQLWSRKGGA